MNLRFRSVRELIPLCQRVSDLEMVAHGLHHGLSDTDHLVVEGISSDVEDNELTEGAPERDSQS